ncbi:hypothetical protein FSP39_003718 [Pinctada imbricata]|uniref:Fcf2 pre-rRNA processing C-terminal domain-containing protein n=1 Tax=Pinctada imbricata TaxID=66713 RepID=A0AA88XK58_PINIB|nr:hypothetical protein FSP39_003718 [Pinctada imbricata]
MLSSSEESESSDSEIDELASMVFRNTTKKIKGVTNGTNMPDKGVDCQHDDSTKSESEHDIGFVIDRTNKSGNLQFDNTPKGHKFDAGACTNEGKKRDKSKVTKKNSGELSSSIECDISINDGYIQRPGSQHGQGRKGKSQHSVTNIYKTRDDEIMKKSVITPDFEKNFSVTPYHESLRQQKKQQKAEREKTKGKGWYNMPAPEMTEERKNDLQVLQMRKALDPKRFYKRLDIKALPKYFQFGKVVENSADFYHSRIPKKQRKSNMVQELLADAEFRKYNKRKYMEIQEAKMKGDGPYKYKQKVKKKKKQ